MNLKSAELDAHGHIVEDGAGDVIEVDMEPADPAAPRPYENLYVNYFDFPDDVDGVLPDRFPLPFRDDGGVDTTTGNATPDQGADNRRVDQNEFEATVATFAGSLAGGKIGVTNAGETVTTAARAQQLVDGTESALAAVTRGNVILTGTDTDPIVLDGDVAIDGDLIISGPIKGVGSLWVKGNIYVRSDLEYNDAVVAGARQFGYAADGFPIYGVWAHEDPTDPDSPLVRPTTSWRVKAGNRPTKSDISPGGAHDGTFVQDWEYIEDAGDLDEHHGQFGVTPEYPDGINYYMITEEYPIIPRTINSTPARS